MCTTTLATVKRKSFSYIAQKKQKQKEIPINLCGIWKELLTCHAWISVKPFWFHLSWLMPSVYFLFFISFQLLIPHRCCNHLIYLTWDRPPIIALLAHQSLYTGHLVQSYCYCARSSSMRCFVVCLFYIDFWVFIIAQNHKSQSLRSLRPSGKPLSPINLQYQLNT